MNDTTRELLLKTRKGATASFETKQWGIVLTELGFGFQVTKTRNSVTEVKVTSPLGHETLTITKQPNYRRITFYELSGWLKKIGVELVGPVSIRLGMDTPDVEKKLKDLYIRDLTNTGTCAVCEGNFKRDGAPIGHHGFRRPGDGMLHGQCFGVSHLPFELSPVGAEAYLAEALKPTLAREEKYLAELPSKTSFLKMPRVSRTTNNLPELITKETHGWEFDQMMASALHQTESKIRMLKRDIEYFTAKVANWKPDELPEVKYAGKFRAA